MDISKLVGTWELVRHGKVDAAGKFTPTAPEMRGQLIYSGDGYMNVLITKRSDATALEHIIAYAGKLRTEGDTLFHDVEVAPDPKRIGKTETRFAAFKDGLLVLTTTPTNGEHYEIAWKKKANVSR